MPEQSALEIVVKSEKKKPSKTLIAGEGDSEDTSVEYVDPFDEGYEVHAANLRGTIKHQKHEIEDTPFHP